MNIRKETDYSTLFALLKAFMSEGLTQMELYRKIGEAVCNRPEKGAVAAAAEYLQKNYPDTAGFSPRNVRRMREFCRTYQSNSSLLAEAMKIGWTQNIVILERCETEEERRWYIQTVQQFGWSTQQLIKEITDSAHTKKALDNTSEVCYNEDENGNHAEYAEEAPVQNTEQSFAQTNTVENSTEVIGRTKDNLDRKPYIQLTSANGANKIHHPYALYNVTSICRMECREKITRNDESAVHCHSPP